MPHTPSASNVLQVHLRAPKQGVSKSHNPVVHHVSSLALFRVDGDHLKSTRATKYGAVAPEARQPQKLTTRILPSRPGPLTVFRKRLLVFFGLGRSTDPGVRLSRLYIAKFVPSYLQIRWQRDGLQDMARLI